LLVRGLKSPVPNNAFQPESRYREMMSAVIM